MPLATVTMRLPPEDSAVDEGCTRLIRLRVRTTWTGRVEEMTTLSARLSSRNWLGILPVGRVLVVEVMRKGRVVDQLSSQKRTAMSCRQD